MKIHQVVQGSPEWHALREQHYCASDAPAMMGVSKHKTRDRYLHQKATGEKDAVSPHQQKRFDDGHRTEASIRPHMSKMIGMELLPVTCTEIVQGLPLLASLDGMTMCSTTIMEHKLWSEELAAMVKRQELTPHYTVQMDQQLALSGADRCLFVTSDGTPEKCAWMWYAPNPSAVMRLMEGWQAFHLDLQNYKPPVEGEVITKKAPAQLPAITYQLDGLALRSNLAQYRAAAEKLVEESTSLLETDQDFENAAQDVKDFDDAEQRIAEVQKKVVGEFKDVQAFTEELEEIKQLIRRARLNRTNQIDSRKAQRRKELIVDGEVRVQRRLQEWLELLGGDYLPQPAVNFTGAIKGKSNFSKMKDAILAEVNRVNALVDQLGAVVQTNREAARDHLHLFPDFKLVCTKAPEDFLNLLNARVQVDAQRVAEEARQQREKEIAAQKAAEVAQAPEVKVGDTIVAPGLPVDGQVITAVAPAQIHRAGTTAPDGFPWEAGDDYLEPLKVRDVPFTIATRLGPNRINLNLGGQVHTISDRDGIWLREFLISLNLGE